MAMPSSNAKTVRLNWNGIVIVLDYPRTYKNPARASIFLNGFDTNSWHPGVCFEGRVKRQGNGKPGSIYELGDGQRGWTAKSYLISGMKESEEMIEFHRAVDARREARLISEDTLPSEQQSSTASKGRL